MMMYVVLMGSKGLEGTYTSSLWETLRWPQFLPAKDPNSSRWICIGPLLGISVQVPTLVACPSASKTETHQPASVVSLLVKQEQQCILRTVGSPLRKSPGVVNAFHSFIHQFNYTLDIKNCTWTYLPITQVAGAYLQNSAAVTFGSTERNPSWIDATLTSLFCVVPVASCVTHTHRRMHVRIVCI